MGKLMGDRATGYSKIGIVGAGAIGSGIAQLVSSLGVETVVVAPRPGGVERAASMMRHCYQHDVERGRITPAEAEAGLNMIRCTPDYAELDGAELVIESVPEDLPIKVNALKAVESNTGNDCIFGTNTSSIPIAKIAAESARPGNVIGMHYFWPAHRFKLVEIAFGPETAPRTIERTLDVVRWQGKTPLLVKDSPGFFTTRILIPYINEAVALVADGAPIEAVDKAMTDFGWAMGPFHLMDAAGIETLARVYASVADLMGDRARRLQRLWPIVGAGHVGFKGGSRRAGVKGFYLYPEGRQVDSQVYSLLRDGVTTPPDDGEVARRPVFQMINEVAHCLAEGVVATPEEADMGAVLGIGWPHTRQGPLAYARQIGLDSVVRQLEEWAEKYGPRFKPSSALAAIGSKGWAS
jgi:3-hydroxyacyl-CoA dehydrogenase/enoyl-CoA hydratase/3-hydroxybutyryl-CoA epimerase